MADHRAFKELQRIFGSERVAEEFTAPQNQFAGALKDRWCYTVTIEPDAPFIPHENAVNNFDFRSLGTRLEGYLENRLDIDLSSLDSAISSNAHEHSYQKPEILRFVFTARDLETEENISALRNLSTDAIKNALVLGKSDKAREDYNALLRKATHGLRWNFVSNQDGEFYESNRPLRSPDGLQMGLLSRLAISDDHFIPSSPDGKARISLSAIIAGRSGALMESILPKRVCEPVKKNEIIFGRS